jgi:hypothetical protein
MGLDEAYLKINGVQHYLSHTVDQNSIVPIFCASKA